MFYKKRVASTHLIPAGVSCRLAFPIVLVVTICFSCSSHDDGVQKEEAFPVVNPVVKDTSYSKEYLADIHAIQNIELRAKIDGYLESIHTDEGQYVERGQLLFVISGKKYNQDLIRARAAVASAKAQLKAAEVELSNARTLVENAITSNVELELAEAKYEALRAKVQEATVQEASASLQLSFAQIRAPFNGFINRIPNKVGSLIEEGTLLTTLSDNREVNAYFNVSEREYLEYVSESVDEKGEVELILSNGKLHPFKGKIETIEGEIDRSTGNIAFRARFPNPDKIIKHGSSGKVVVRSPLKHALLIPQKSTFEIQDIMYVYVVGVDNILQRRKIVPSVRLPHWFVVSEGLSIDDKVLYEGIQRVKEGDRIVPRSAPSQPQLSHR